MKRCQACGEETDLMRAIGPVLLCAGECAPQMDIEISKLRAAGQRVDVTVIARRMYNRLHDNTRTERVTRRNEELNAKARELGFDGLSQMLTAWKNGEIKIIVEK